MNPTPSQQPSVLRGSGWNDYHTVAVRAAKRVGITRSHRDMDVGFRCTLTGRLPR
jgi:hypothetical protein